MMKRFVSMLMVLTLLLSACGQKAPSWQEQYDLGIRYLSEGNYEEAIIAFTAAIEIDPKKAEAYVGRADAYLAAGETQENLTAALDDYETATGLSAASEAAWVGLADVYIRIGDYEKAAEVLQQAIDTLGQTDALTAVQEKLQGLLPPAQEPADEPETPIEEPAEEPETPVEQPAETPAIEETELQGYCGGEGDGTNLIWRIDPDAGTLTISGTGAMADYEAFYSAWGDEGTTAPWYNYIAARCEENPYYDASASGVPITTFIVEEGVTYLGNCAITSCYFETVQLADSIESMGEYALIKTPFDVW